LSLQCAYVSFVSGTGPTGGSGGCANSSGITISSTSDSKLGAFTSDVGSGPAAASSASPSASKGAASSSMEPMAHGPLGTVAWMVVVAAVSCAVSLV